MKLNIAKPLCGSILLLCATIVVCAPGTAMAQSGSSVPQFKDYPAGEMYKGPTAPLVLTRRDRVFKTKLQMSAKNESVNFAGHYILTRWGCGADCVMGAVIDAKTGRVYRWNFTTCCWGMETDDNFNPIEFRPDSRLIAFSGLRNEKDSDDGKHFYRFDNSGRFMHIRSVLKSAQTIGGKQSILGNWTVRSIIIESDMAYGIMEPVTLKIDENGKISGNGGCNDYGGSYSFKDPKESFKETKKIKFTDIISTKKFCPSASNTENSFFRSLREAATVAFEKEELVIKNRATIVRSSRGNILIQNTMTLVREVKPKHEKGTAY